MQKTIKLLATVLILNVLLMISDVTYASLLSSTNSGINVFKPTIISSYRINEDFDGINKTNVTITNTGNVPSYIRVALTLNFLDKDGKVLALKPIEGEDYLIDINKRWLKKDKLYYYPGVLKKGETSDNILNSLTSLNDEYELSATILVQGIGAFDLDRSGDLIHLYD